MRRSSWIAFSAAVMLAGCQATDKLTQQSDFFPETNCTSVQKFVNVQTAQGARADAMLYAHHFHGAQLNSLGTQKLSLMIASDEPARPMTVYMVDLGQDDLLENRRQAVRDFLADALRPDESVEFVSGTNPATLRPAAEAIAQKARLESAAHLPTGDPAYTPMR